jgi:hypothetical protein
VERGREDLPFLMRIGTGLLFLILVTIACRASFWSPKTPDNVTSSDIAGTFAYKVGGKKTMLHLNSDGTFEITDSGLPNATGTWTLKQAEVSLTYRQEGGNPTRLVGYVGGENGSYYLLIGSEADDPDNWRVFLPTK